MNELDYFCILNLTDADEISYRVCVLQKSDSKGQCCMKLKKKAVKTPIGKIKSLCLALFNSNLKGKKKWAVIGIILYIISPIDIIPDFVPMAGYADDILLPILFLVVERLLNSDTNTGYQHSPIQEAEKVD